MTPCLLDTKEYMCVYMHFYVCYFDLRYFCTDFVADGKLQCLEILGSGHIVSAILDGYLDGP